MNTHLDIFEFAQDHQQLTDKLTVEADRVLTTRELDKIYLTDIVSDLKANLDDITHLIGG